MLEKKIEAYLRGKVKKLGGLALKLVSPGRVGVPDRLILLPGGRAVFAEVKAPGEKPRLNQQRMHDRLRALGFEVVVPDTLAAVDEVIERLTGGAADEI